MRVDDEQKILFKQQTLFLFLSVERLCEPIFSEVVTGNSASVMIFLVYCLQRQKLIFDILTFRIPTAMMLICISGLIGISNKV